jgi:hypothetical protein
MLSATRWNTRRKRSSLRTIAGSSRSTLSGWPSRRSNRPNPRRQAPHCRPSCPHEALDDSPCRCGRRRVCGQGALLMRIPSGHDRSDRIDGNFSGGPHPRRTFTVPPEVAMGMVVRSHRGGSNLVLADLHLVVCPASVKATRRGSEQTGSPASMVHLRCWFK